MYIRGTQLERWHFYFKRGFLPMLFGKASVVRRQVFSCWYMCSVLYMSSKRTETDTTDEPQCCIVMWPPVRFHYGALNHLVTFRQVVWHKLLFLYRVRYQHIICHLTFLTCVGSWIWFYFKLDGFRAYCAIKCIHYMNK